MTFSINSLEELLNSKGILLTRVLRKENSLTFCLNIQASPGRKKDEIIIQSDGSLKVLTKAPAVDGKANSAIKKLLAETFCIAPSQCEQLAGGQSKKKIFCLSFDFRSHSRKDERYYIDQISEGFKA